MSEIEKYRQTLKALAESESDQFINNSSMDHAAAMIEELFRNAAGKVFILTDHLHPYVYDRPELRKVAADFLDQSDENNINIVAQLNNSTKDELLSNGFITSLQKFTDRVNIYKANNGLLKDLKNHFMVTMTTRGNFALRFETDINSHCATGTFNAGDNGKKLFQFFQEKLESCATMI